MPYSAEISRANPSCFMFLIDQSGSMGDPFGNGESNRKKADETADAINRLLYNITLTCAKDEGVRDYYDISVIGYGNHVGPVLGGPLSGRETVSIGDLASTPARVEDRNKKVPDGAGGLVDQPIKFPIWIDPVSNGGTPMCQAFNKAKSIISNWISRHSSCFPPIIINITDGESTDGDPTSAAQALKELSSGDGNVLLFNVHLSSQHAPKVEYPNATTQLPSDEFAKMLFNMSSPLTDYMKSVAQQEGFAISDGARGFVFNADIVSVIKFLDIGTRPSNLR